MLKVIPHPGMAPAMLSKSVDAAPSRNDTAVEEFLTSTCTSQPGLSHKQHERHDDSIGDECAAHDKVRKTLAEVVASTVPHGHDSTKEHLSPCHDGHEFAQPAMHDDHASSTASTSFTAEDAPDPSFLLLEMQLQAHTQANLHNEHKNQTVREAGVDVWVSELAALVHVPEEVCHCSDQRAKYL
jgi:hypothetical protein